ncbi:MAG TPA: DUF2891 domain-containing protein [Burkholderiales bacterium]|jgi:hypothetical protein|nr:DUF2891 domain-containing protein [Burkholderiales bacterium]
MNVAQAERFAGMALACLEREFPFQPAHVMAHAADWARPGALHPAFHGCYDWHSAVHAHWLLARMLRRFPQIGAGAAIRARLDRTLTRDNLLAEARYLEAHPGFERPYGWAWVLQLARELDELHEERWSAAIAPLAETVERLYLAWLPRQTYPIRSGVHTNTAFALTLGLDYADRMGRAELSDLLRRRAIDYFAGDSDYPAAWEPGGNDFLSPCLVEAELMRRVVPDFGAWLEQFLPAPPRSLLEPAAVSDRTDGQLAHLDGLNLSRAWCFYGLGMREAAERHLQAGLAHVQSGSYEGEHWLASFAVLALDAQEAAR